MLQFLKKILKFILLLLIVVLIGSGIYVWTVIDDAPTITKNQLKAKPNREGQQTYIKADNIPKRYRSAVVSTEDSTFETNNGINREGLRALIESNVKALFGQGVGRGGSSITQQLVKLTAFQNDADPTVKRKIQELYLALKLNHTYSKDQIFEYYVNKIFEGYNRYGAETISQFYYQKSLNQLSLDQQATIAGIGQSPTTFNLYTNQDMVKKRRDIVLISMLNNNQITKSAYQQAVKEPITHGLVSTN